MPIEGGWWRRREVRQIFISPVIWELYATPTPQTPFPFSIAIAPATLVPWLSRTPSTLIGKALLSRLKKSYWRNLNYISVSYDFECTYSTIVHSHSCHLDLNEYTPHLYWHYIHIWYQKLTLLHYHHQQLPQQFHILWLLEAMLSLH